MRPFKHKRLPSLGALSEREVVDEFRRLERWSQEVGSEIRQRPVLDWVCPGDNYKLTALDCDGNKLIPVPATYYPSLAVFDGDPAVYSQMNYVFSPDKVIGFMDLNEMTIGGIGVPQVTGGDTLLVVGTANLEDWENTATRRPLSVGGSNVTIDAGTSMTWRLPGVTGNTTGYNLQIAADGVSVLAVENPQPDWEDADTSPSNGVSLGNTDWTDFPSGVSSDLNKLTITVPAPQDPGTVYMRATVGVEETGNKDGQIDIGVGINGADPAADDWETYTIPANSSTRLTLSMLFGMDVELTDPVLLSVMYRADVDNHVSTNFVSDTSEGDHEFDAYINRGGGGGAVVSNHQLLDNRNPASPDTAHDSAVIGVDPTGMTYITLGEVQAALGEVDTKLIDLEGRIGGSRLHADLTDTATNGHPAAAIAVDDTDPYIRGATVQSALEAHVAAGGATPGHHASGINYDPAGDAHIGTNNVYGALKDLDAAIPIGGVGVSGQGGFADASGLTTQTLSSATVFETLDPNTQTAFPGTSGVTVGTAGYLQIDDPAGIRRVRLHAIASIEVTDFIDGDVFRIRIQRMSDGVTLNGVIDPVVVKDPNFNTKFYLNVSLSCLDADVHAGSNYYAVQIRNYSRAGTDIRLDTFSFWLDYD